MNIRGSYPIICNFGNQNFWEKKSNFNKLHQLSKDTVSFGSSASAKKMVEKFKTYNPNGQYNIKQSEAEAIYKYFGYELSNGGSHKQLTGPYGQTYTYKDQSPIDPSNASALIRGIQMADEFEGELIMFSKKPSAEQVQEWKQRIAERTPSKGYLNSYAIDNKERLQSNSAHVENPITIDAEKEQDKNINELKAKISIIMTSLLQQQEDFGALVAEYGEIKENAQRNKIQLAQEVITSINEQIKAQIEEFSRVQTTLESYKEKLSKNSMLSDEEIGNLNLYQDMEIDYSKIEEAIMNLEEKIVQDIQETQGVQNSQEVQTSQETQEVQGAKETTPIIEAKVENSLEVAKPPKDNFIEVKIQQ